VAYLKTFLSVFIILMFIFVLQTVWLYISELAGKDIDFWIILKFLWFFAPKLIPLVLPLTILVTSLMVFGNFAEKYEFAAMKSTGISLQRAMRSLTYFIVLLAITAFFFANNVIPYSEYKWQNLRRNIAQVSPSMAIVAGQFSSIGDDFNIKVSDKYGDRGQFLDSIVIHKKNPKSPNKNTTVIIATAGELVSEEGSNTLSLILKDGNYYEDILLDNAAKRSGRPFAKSYFEEYILNIDLTALNDTDIDQENELSNHNMYSAKELFAEIDTLSNKYTKDIVLYAENMYYRTGANKFRDTIKGRQRFIKDTTYTDVLDAFEPRQQAEIVQTALNNLKGTLQSLNSKKIEFQIKTKRLNKHEIALHEKFALGFTCIILFFVGAPLGAIIRKGGMGLPMVVAVLLFLTYHFIGIFAKNSAEDGTMHPFIASWISTAIMLPLGIWLTYRATTDQGILDMDAFLQRLGRLFNKNSKEELIEFPPKQLLLTQQEKAMLLSRSDYQLKDILKNYRQYDYSEDLRLGALERLKEKGFSEGELKMTGDFENLKYTDAARTLKSFSKNSRRALEFYLLTLLSFAFLSFTYMTQSMVLGYITTALFYLRPVFIILFYFFGIRALLDHSKFIETIGKKKDTGIWLIFILFGLIVYLFIHLSVKKKMKEEMQMIR
jgi:lipopolysaccharide export system permease protein